MKLSIRPAAAPFLTLALLAAPAHAAVVLSNIGQAPAGFDRIIGPASAENAHATAFTTGSNPGGYSLSSISIAILHSGTESSTTGNFAVGLYNSDGTTPSSQLSLLNGNSNPDSTGNFSYTATGVTLAPSTTYWIVAQVTSGSGAYLWRYANDNTADSVDPGWSFGSSYADFNSIDGWIAANGAPSLYSIDASPVPEPAEYASIAGIAGLLAAGWMRRRRF
jgi:hypothetical protein